jgi:hypothetical protein
MNESWAGPNAAINRFGFDLDGVISSEHGALFQLARLVQIPALTRHCQHNAECLQRPILGVIISCRRESDRPLTEAWLTRNHIKRPLYLCADVAEKAARINELELTHYYENQRSVAYRLAALCPRTIIQLTGEVRA